MKLSVLGPVFSPGGVSEAEGVEALVLEHHVQEGVVVNRVGLHGNLHHL